MTGAHYGYAVLKISLGWLSYGWLSGSNFILTDFSRFFEYFIILVILLNSLVLSLYDYSDKDSTTPYNIALDKV